MSLKTIKKDKNGIKLQKNPTGGYFRAEKLFSCKVTKIFVKIEQKKFSNTIDI